MCLACQNYDLRLPSQQSFRLRWAARKSKTQQTIKELANTCEHQQIKTHASDCERACALGAHHGLRGGLLPAYGRGVAAPHAAYPVLHCRSQVCATAETAVWIAERAGSDRDIAVSPTSVVHNLKNHCHTRPVTLHRSRKTEYKPAIAGTTKIKSDTGPVTGRVSIECALAYSRGRFQTPKQVDLRRHISLPSRLDLFTGTRRGV
eukprot:6214771-Pleurochrysis_carterae.AAC.1